MADIESRVDKIESRMTGVEVTVEKLSQKVDDFISESRANHKRHEDDIREMRTKHDNDMQAIRQSIEGMGKHVRNMSIVAIIGIAAMVIAVLLK
ncbi:MAG: hypothetical protein IJS81_10870 [Selenomonadaceae bacterium]|nr:hypothetical protein [Selenomonadaceae bacterium]